MPNETGKKPMLETVATFSIDRLAFLDEQGRAQGPLPDFANEKAELVRLYEAMVLTRTFDAKAVALQRTGRLGTYASSLGQEAVAVGIGAAMHDDDVLVPSFREHGAQLLRGVTMTELFLYWGGDERGSDFSGPREDFPVCIPVASQVPHAVGVAMAMELRRQKRATVCVCGDGATSKGDFYEGINAAGIWKLPVVFIVDNNEWAISVPRSAQTAAETLAQKAVAAGMEGIQVDGNDVVAVRHAVAEAVTRARAGGGPMLIESQTYRLADHTTADDASRYRDDADVSKHWVGEPVARLRSFLVEQEHWNKKDEEQLLARCRDEVEAAAEQFLTVAPQEPESIFDHLFAELPEETAAQRRSLSDTGQSDE